GSSWTVPEASSGSATLDAARATTAAPYPNAWQRNRWHLFVMSRPGSRAVPGRRSPRKASKRRDSERDAQCSGQSFASGRTFVRERRLAQALRKVRLVCGRPLYPCPVSRGRESPVHSSSLSLIVGVVGLVAVTVLGAATLTGEGHLPLV